MVQLCTTFAPATTTWAWSVANASEYFTTSAKAMCHHSQLCKPALAGIDDDDNWEEESDINDNDKDDDDFTFS